MKAAVIFVFLVLIIITSNISIAAYGDEETEESIYEPITIPERANFNSAQLELVFRHSYDALRQAGPVTLEGSRAGHRVMIGNVYGTITAQPSENRILVIQGNYSVAHDGISFSVLGNMYIKKIAQKTYPEITLIVGEISASGMRILCRYPDCSHIVIDAETGKMKVNGKASIIGRRLRSPTSLAEDITIQALPRPVSNTVNLRFEAGERPEEGKIARIGNFRLKAGSNGKYALKILNIGSIIEYISGDVIILEILDSRTAGLDPELNDAIYADSQNFLHDGQNDIFVNLENAVLRGEEFLKIQSGNFLYTWDEQLEECKRTESDKSCITLTPSGNSNIMWVTLKLKNSIPAIATLNLDHSILSKINVERFSEEDVESELIITSPLNLGNRKMIFKRDNVLIDGDWKDFRTSFSAYLYRFSEGEYDLLECTYNYLYPRNSQCTLNGNPINLEQRTQRCTTDNDCDGNICRQNRCVQERRCVRMFGDGDPRKIDLLIIGEDTERIQDVEKIAIGEDGQSGLIFGYGGGGLFETEPFRTYRERFNIWIMTAPAAHVRPAELVGLVFSDMDLSGCPEANIKVIASEKEFRSHASDEGICTVSLKKSYLQQVFIHEIGHCFGRLADEYLEARNYRGHYLIPNCIADIGDKSAEEIAKEEWSKLLCGQSESCIEADRLVQEASRNFRGCGGPCLRRCNNYLRPSRNSIMRNYPQPQGRSFNLISQKWIEKRIMSW